MYSRTKRREKKINVAEEEKGSDSNEAYFFVSTVVTRSAKYEYAFFL
jgi:hypothetical protein